MTDTSRRDHTSSLLMRLVETIDDGAADHEPSLRHLAIGALNLATEAGEETVIAAGRALPWLGIFLQWQGGQTSVDTLVETIESHDLVRRLGSSSLRRRLARVDGDATSNIRRDPDDAPTARVDRRARALTDIFDHDRRIDAVARCTPADCRDALIDDTGLLATALEVRADDNSDGDGPFADVLPDWPIDAPSAPLEVLARFENTGFETVPVELAMLDERSRQFEQSLATHLMRHDLLYAIRAALAFAPTADAAPVSNRRLRRFLTGFTVFADDPALLQLTLALIDVRHHPVEHLRGTAPLESLSCWIEFLRGRCVEFSESRGFSLREATNFAHYSLHLIDICDLAGDDQTVVDDGIRRAIMDIEDELKEFALAGQREGLGDQDADLHRYERTRWRSSPPRTLLADRLARLAGGWRSGHCSGPPGSAPRPDDDLFETARGLVDPDTPAPELDAATHLIGHARLVGASFVESWSPRQLLSILVVALSAARQSPDIDVDRPFIIDLRRIDAWLQHGQPGRRTELLEHLVETCRPVQQRSPLNADGGLVADVDGNRLVIDVDSSEQLEALLTLLASEDDEAFAQTLRRRIHDIIEGTAPSTDDGDPSPTPEPSQNRPPTRV